MTDTAPPSGTAASLRPDRRQLRRQQTIGEILDISVDVMTEEGVNGLTLSEVARRLGVRPPSLYKYFPSLGAVFDALFERGQLAHLEAMRAAMAGTEPGLEALGAGLDASGRWCVANRALAQLLFWRPVPNFEPSAEAMAPSHEMIELQRGALRDAMASGQLGPGADEMEAIYLVSTMIAGVISQTLANEPGTPWSKGRFGPMLPRLLALIPAAYPPATRRGGR
jgi:AcrR family transcriptional regulator